MSGLIALLDDVAAIAKVAASSIDDVAGQAAKAGAKAAGAVIDDAAVTPKYVQGFEPDRELPIVWQIAKGSIFNKLVILLPAALILSAFAPWAIIPLLMLGGLYLCFEGAEKVWHVLHPSGHHDNEGGETGDPAHLEREKVAGAIKTDFILSAEIMTIALAAIPSGSIWMQGATLAVVAIGITVAVYGSVALIVKADDIGLHMSQEAATGAMRALGRGIVKSMPGFLRWLTIIGTAAMLWVGGSIVIHGIGSFGWHGLEHWIKHQAEVVAQLVPEGVEGVVNWAVVAGLDGVFGLFAGLLVIPVATFVLIPAWSALRGRSSA